MMHLYINGEDVLVPDHVETVSHLLKHFQLEQKVVIVELNENILDKTSHQEKSLQDRDKIEIVNFVGGG